MGVKITKFLMLCHFLLILAPAYGQDLVTGKVISSYNSEPLIGATVAIKNTNKGTITDVEGKFTLKAAEGAVLSISYIGYHTREITVGSAADLTVTLDPDLQTLSEVVVVGYGTQEKKDVTGAISSIKLEEIEGVPFQSVDQVLQGRAAGVFFVQSSGMPGAGASVRIRGGNSINGSNEPLYVIDGIPISAGVSSSSSLNPLNTINPNDIASIEVLKDASATAIYGSRGGNGVVLITTRRGRTGEARVNFNAYYGMQEEINRYELLNAKQFETLANEASMAEGGPLIYDPELNPISTDWQDALFRDYARVQNYNLSITGGDEKTQYITSFDYYDQEGIIHSSDLERFSYRLNIDKKINEKIKVGNSLTASYIVTNRVNSASLFSMLTTAPNLPIKQADGSYTRYNNQGIGFNNPVALLNDYTNLNKKFRAIGNVFASAELAKGLTFRSSWGLDLIYSKNDTYIPQTVYSGSLVGGDGAVSMNQNFTWINENTLTYKKKVNEHQFDVLAGFTQQSARYEALGASATGFLNDVTRTYALGLGNPEAAELPVTSTAQWTILSFIGRLNYSFKDRYLLTLTGRSDGSSRFGDNNRYGFFPSVALGWRAIEEDFIQNLGVFSNLKLRASYGITGNQEGIGNFPALDLWGGTEYIIGDQIVTGVTPVQVGNKNLQWEKTTQYDIGLEAGFFNNRLNFTADAYYKKTNDLLLRITVPATSGFTSGTKNIGAIENKGIELAVDAVVLDNGSLRWNSNFNISLNENKIVNLGGEEEILPSDSPTILKVGESLGTFYGYVSDGLFQNVDEIALSAQPSAKPGDIRFVDTNDDNVINESDQQVIGNAQPRFYGGFNNTLSYKGFELSALLQYVYGNDLYNLNIKTLENLRGLQNQRTEVLDRWTPDNRDTNIPRASSTKSSDLPYDRYVEDGSYLRVKNVQLAYNFPAHIYERLKVSSLRLYVNAQNLFTFTNYSGLDPEVSRYGSDNINQGFDSGSYPNVKLYTAGLSIGF